MFVYVDKPDHKREQKICWVFKWKLGSGDFKIVIRKSKIVNQIIISHPQ